MTPPIQSDATTIVAAHADDVLPETIKRPAAAPKIHLGYIDSLRAMAAIYVMLHHMLLEVLPGAFIFFPFHGFKAYSTAWLLYGHYGVSAFIVISGFSLMIPVVRNNYTLPGGIGQFLLRRAQRILPPFYIALGFTLLLIWLFIGQPTGTHWDVSLPVTKKDILFNLLMVQDLFAYGKINHAFWSISVEWRIYFIFPLIVFLRRSFTIIATLLFAILIYTFYFNMPATLGSSLFFIPFSYIGLFALGTAATTVALSSHPTWQLLRDSFPWLLVGFSMLPLFYLVSLQPLTSATYTINDILIGIFTCSLLIAGARPGQNMYKRLVNWKPLVFIGGFSYSIYLIHAPLVHVVWLYIAHPLSQTPYKTFVILAVVGSPLIIGAAYLFYLVAERPFMKTKRQEKLLGLLSFLEKKSPAISGNT